MRTTAVAVGELPFECGVPMVVDVVIDATQEKTCDRYPLVPKPLVYAQDGLILLRHE